MDLESIQNKKIRNQLRYLQLELEETKIIYQGCIEKFNNDFRSYMLDNNPEPTQVKLSEDKNLKINTEVDDDTFKQVYRKVAGKTHPDKIDGNEKLFKSANQANRNKDFGHLLEMADELGIDVNLDDKFILEMKKQCSAIIKNVELMKTTMAWTWVHLPQDQKKTFREYVLQQLQVE